MSRGSTSVSRGIGRAGTGTSPIQGGAPPVGSAPALGGPGSAPSGHGLVSAGWPAGPWCQIPVPGTQTQTETNTAAAAVRLSGESKADLYNNNITENWIATWSASLIPLNPFDNLMRSVVTLTGKLQGSYGHGKPGKVMEF